MTNGQVSKDVVGENNFMSSPHRRRAAGSRFFAVALGVCGVFLADIFGAGTILGQENTQVLVVATLHQRHASDTNYTYQDIAHILSTYAPDVVCVEIRPKDFRREPYLKEMMLATIWGLDHGKQVYPIDWWEDSNDRHIRDSLSALPEYVEKEKRLNELEKNSPVIQAFEKEYGSWKDQGQKGYEFWNGKEYNEYVAEGYRLSMDVYGDSPFNLHYQTRNDKMMALILAAARENNGRKIVVLTGAEHKHYFDRALKRTAGITTLSLHDILPLKEPSFSPMVLSFFENYDDLPYFEEGYPRDLNAYYRMKLIPLLHGPNMDFKPEIIPSKNIDAGEVILARWQGSAHASDASDLISFELGWLNFLKGDYAAAITHFLPLTEKVESGAINDPFLKHIIYRNLGFCYDLSGDRDKAVASYERGENLLKGTPFERMTEQIFADYKTHPYHRPGR